MGIRFRKSVNLGPVRVNLSKSGIGYSAGVKGARLTKLANGRNRTTLGIPGTGLTYVTETSSAKHNNTKKQADNQEQTSTFSKQELILQVKKLLKALPITQLTEDNARPIVEQVENYYKLERKCLYAIPVAFILFSWHPAAAVLAVVSTIIGSNVILKRVKIDLDELQSQYISNQYDFAIVWKSIKKCERIMLKISEIDIIDEGNYRLLDILDFTNIVSKNKLPKVFKYSGEYLYLYYDPFKIIFLSRGLLLIKNTQVSFVEYNQILFDIGAYNIPDTSLLTKDTKIINRTWLYTKADGSPDRRMKDNVEIPICLYGILSMNIKNFLNIQLLLSNSEMVYPIKNQIDLMLKKFWID
jgi:hypothetical protein